MENKCILYVILIISVLFVVIFATAYFYQQENNTYFKEGVPEITAIEAPNAVLIYENIKIRVNVTELGGIKRVSLWYKSPDGIEKTIIMSREIGCTYATYVPSQNFTGSLFYCISVEDVHGGITKTPLYMIEITPRIEITEAVSMVYSQIIRPLRGENETDIYVYSEFPKNEHSLPKAKILENNEKISDSTGVLYNVNSPVWFLYVPNLFTSNSSNTSEACIFVNQHGDIDIRPCISPIKIDNTFIFETVFDGNIPVTIFDMPKGFSYPSKESLENATAKAINYLQAYGDSKEKVLVVCKNPVIYTINNVTRAYWVFYTPTVGEGFSQGSIYNIDCDTGKISHLDGITLLNLPYNSEYRVYMSVSMKNPSWNYSVVIFYSIPEVEKL